MCLISYFVFTKVVIYANLYYVRHKHEHELSWIIRCAGIRMRLHYVKKERVFTSGIALILD